MKHFKSHNPGMSLLEVIGAMAVLAIFGSSIFLMQQYLFDRMSISQQKMIACTRMQTEMIAMQTDIVKALFEGESIEKSLEEKVTEFGYPDMTITTKAHTDFEKQEDQKENSFKIFKDVVLLDVRAQDADKDFGAMYAFVYVPKDTKK